MSDVDVFADDMAERQESVLNFALLLKDYDDASQRIKELEKMKDRIRTDILINMKLANMERMETTSHSVIYSMQKRKVLDKKALETFLNANKSSYDMFVKTNEYEMLKVIPKGNSEEQEDE